jgi:hypothetical protein
MRPPVTGAKIGQLMSALGQEVTGPGTVDFDRDDPYAQALAKIERVYTRGSDRPLQG